MEQAFYERETSSYDRAVSFFDAIYGFSLTLLIANLDVPPPPAWESIDDLLSHDVGSQLLGFLISFVVIAVFWRRNHQLVAGFTGVDSTLITCNIAAAGLVIFIPFSTQGMSDPATAEYALPTSLYAVNIAAAMLAQTAMVVVARRHGLAAKPGSTRQLRLEYLDAALPPAVFLASVPVAHVWDGNTAKYCWLLLIVLGPLSARKVARSQVQ